MEVALEGHGVGAAHLHYREYIWKNHASYKPQPYTTIIATKFGHFGGSLTLSSYKKIMSNIIWKLPAWKFRCDSFYENWIPHNFFIYKDIWLKLAQILDDIY